jgi:hypothetical protein
MTDFNHTMERGAEAGAYGGAGTATLLWGMSVSEVAVTASAIFAGLSFLVHLYFSWRRDKREQALHDLELEDHSADTPFD